MRHTTLTALAVAGVLTLAACGGDSSTATPAAQVATTLTSTVTSGVTSAVPSTVAATSPTVPATTTTTAAPAVAKVSANNASRAQLAAAFEAAGISNASRWAVEVEEYRPYPTNDPTYAKLRQNLAKYNPGPGVVDAIIATLTLEQ